MKQNLFTTILVLSACLFGCGLWQKGYHGNGRPWIRTLQSGSHGVSVSQEATATWITGEEALQDLVAELAKLRIPEKDLSTLSVDFDRCRLLLLEMGQHGTGGHSLSLNEANSRVSGGTAVIAVDWSVPLEGAAVSQALTSPYLLLEMEKADYRRVAVIDQEGNRLFMLETPGPADDSP